MSWAEVAEFQAHPDADGTGYTVHDEYGWASCSDAGMQQMIRQAQLKERYYDTLETFRGLLAPLCADHGLPLLDVDSDVHPEPFRWFINDYADWGDDPRSPLFCFGGWHDRGPENYVYCIAASARGTLGGDLIACEGDWLPAVAR